MVRSARLFVGKVNQTRQAIRFEVSEVEAGSSLLPSIATRTLFERSIDLPVLVCSNGWLLKFIPYVKRGKNEPVNQKNPVLELNDFPGPKDARKEAMGKITGCTSNMLPSGLARAPVKCVNKATGQVGQLEFVAGLVGVSQSTTDLSLRALTGWMICEGRAIDKLIATLCAEHEALPPVKMDSWEMSRRFAGVPGDILRFYSQTGGATITVPDSEMSWLVLPLAEIRPAWERAEMEKELTKRHQQGDLSIEALAELQQVNLPYGRLVRIGWRSDDTWYVLGRHPQPQAEELPRVDKDAQAVFHWTGERNPEAFTYVSPNFSEWLKSLLKK